MGQRKETLAMAVARYEGCDTPCWNKRPLFLRGAHPSSTNSLHTAKAHKSTCIVGIVLGGFFDFDGTRADLEIVFVNDS